MTYRSIHGTSPSYLQSCSPLFRHDIQKTAAVFYRGGGALKSRDLTTRLHVAFADFAFPVCYALMSRKTTELYVKVFQRVQQLVPQFAPCAIADFEEASVAGFFLDNRLCQITVQTLQHYYCYVFHPLTHTCAVDGVCS